MKPDSPGQELSPRVFQMETCTTFSKYYDEVQDCLRLMAGMDQLLPGMKCIFFYYTEND